jgi:hypothetical protein
MSSCLDKVNAALVGPCQRQSDPIEAGCLKNPDDCQAVYGKDGSTYCGDKNWGCCYRLTPPTANIEPCCLGQKDSYQDCGNQYCPLSDACVPTLGQYCGANPTNVMEPLCQTFCALPENKKYCDAAMQKHCDAQKSAGVKDPLCTCIWAAQDKSIAPTCFNAECTATGYQTSDQYQASLSCPTYCPQIVNCYNTGTCSASGSLIKTHCCGPQYPTACGSSGGGGGGQTWAERFQQFFAYWTASTPRKIVGSSLAIAILIALFFLVYFSI